MHTPSANRFPDARMAALCRPVRNSRRFAAAGATLLELLVAVLVVLVLAALLVPVLGSLRERVWTTQCASNMRQYGTFVLRFAVENKGSLVDSSPLPEESRGPNYSNWNMALKYYFQFTAEDQRRFLCPKHLATIPNKGVPTQSFGRPDWMRAAVKDSNGVIVGGTYLKLSQVRNLSQIIFMGDGIVISPTNNAWSIGSYRHQGKANFWFLDGHIELLSPDEYKEYDSNRKKNLY